MKKKGQAVFGMSFGMIFSIIIIIFIIMTAFFAIKHFLSWNNCAQVGIFYDDLQGEITKAWRDGIYNDEFEIKLPKKVEMICFGNFTEAGSSPDRFIQDTLKAKYPGLDDRKTYVFLISKKEVCNGLEYKTLEHAQAQDNFFCKDLSNSNNKIRLTIKSTESLVKIEKE